MSPSKRPGAVSASATSEPLAARADHVGYGGGVRRCLSDLGDQMGLVALDLGRNDKSRLAASGSVAATMPANNLPASGERSSSAVHLPSRVARPRQRRAETVLPLGQDGVAARA